jgi:GNAT superfamily N-acetyltransferase
MTIQYYRLKNGITVTIRPAQLRDAQLIWEMHQRLSETSIYKRYHRHYQPSLAALENLCQIDPKAGAVFVATVDSPGERVIGMGYYLIEDDPTIAEPALLVEDDFQGYGLGRHLGQHLVEHAVQQGIHSLNVYALSTNEAITRLIHRSGLPSRSVFSHGVREILIELPEQPTADPQPDELIWQNQPAIKRPLPVENG